MPTNILRRRNTPIRPANKQQGLQAGNGQRSVLITAGKVELRATLLDTETARRIWQVLPIYSTCETWGQSIQFETAAETPRERNARLLPALGDVCFWSEEDRVVIAFGPTPISKPNEMRLPRPCNIWARTNDDVGLLKSVTPGEKVSVTAVSS